MNIGGPELVIILFVLALLLLPVWGVIDAATRPDRVWHAADQNKIVWVLVILFLPIAGSIAYFAVIRLRLKSVQPGI